MRVVTEIVSFTLGLLGVLFGMAVQNAVLIGVGVSLIGLPAFMAAGGRGDRQRTMCPMGRPNCGKCENCKNDWWSDVYRQLQSEDIAWVKEQYQNCMLWSGELVEGWALDSMVRPSPVRWVLR